MSVGYIRNKLRNGRKRSKTCGCLIPRMRRPMLFCKMLDTYYRVLTLILDGNFQCVLSILSCKANIYKYITWQACNIIHVPSNVLSFFTWNHVWTLGLQSFCIDKFLNQKLCLNPRAMNSPSQDMLSQVLGYWAWLSRSSIMFELRSVLTWNCSSSSTSWSIKISCHIFLIFVMRS